MFKQRRETYRKILQVDHDGEGHAHVFIGRHHTSSQRDDALRQKHIAALFTMFVLDNSSRTFCLCKNNWFKTYSWSLCAVTQPPFIVFPRVLREDAAAHLGVDVEVPVALKVSLLALCIVEQEAVFDDEESLYRGRQWKQQWVNPVGLKGTNVVLRTERWDF